jgi:hypothetical protein
MHRVDIGTGKEPFRKRFALWIVIPNDCIFESK